MKPKRILRALVTVVLLAALVAVLYFSRNADPTNPHASIPEETWIHGPKGHGYAVMNNQQPWKQCYPCHEKQGVGGEEYCQSCHDQSGVKVAIPQKPSQ